MTLTKNKKIEDPDFTIKVSYKNNVQHLTCSHLIDASVCSICSKIRTTRTL